MPKPSLPPGPRVAAVQSLRYLLDPYGYTERMRALRRPVHHAHPQRNGRHGLLERYETDLGARVLREVRNKLRTGLKNPRA